MSKDDQKSPSNSFEDRRRLLRASAAAPLIATLSPGYVMAADSVTCEMKPPNVPEVVFAADNALRAMAEQWVHKTYPDEMYYMIGDSSFAENGRSVPRWFKVSGAVSEEVFEDPRNGSGKIPQYNYVGPCYVLCYVEVDRDADGKIMNVAVSSFHPESAQGVNGDAITHSCWDSINPQGTATVVDLNR